MEIEQIARVAHEVNRAYCAALGDDSQHAWESAPKWQTDSVKMGVILLIATDAGPGGSHDSWMKQKTADGWTLGPVKNLKLKHHPNMVPFADLPVEQQAKDHLFCAVVRALKSTKETS